MSRLHDFDQKYYQLTPAIIGVDEAGRGSWAGPVVAVAVKLYANQFIFGANDSKKISVLKRESIFNLVQVQNIIWAAGIVDSHAIDKINILEATKLAMRMAISKLDYFDIPILIDGPIKLGVSTHEAPIIGGDAKSHAIAIASILAKVRRDAIMVEISRQFPQYHFDKHKGYGTKLHQEALQKFGVLNIHRHTYAPIAKYLTKNSI